MSSVGLEDVDFSLIPGLSELFDEAVDAWGQIKKLSQKFYFASEHELFITLPLAIPAMEPQEFNMKTAIMNSEFMKDLKKIVKLNYWINQWYIIRAALSKPSQPMWSSVATITNGRHVVTFDGKMFTLSDSDQSQEKFKTEILILIRNGISAQKIEICE